MIVITGGSGLIGSALLARLNQAGIYDVVIADKLSTDLRWKNLVNSRFIDYIHGGKLLEALEKGVYGKVDAIVHLGANSYTTERDAGLVMENNYAFSKQLARYSLQHGVRFIYASSAGTYGDGSLGFDDDPALIPQLRPITLYGFSKQAFDLWTLDAKVYDKICGIKFFNVYGPNGYHKAQLPSGQRQFETLRDTGVVQLFKSGHPDFADGESTRDFVYVKDTADVLLWLIQNPKVCGIYNLGSGEACSWNRLARAVCAAAKKPERIEYIPMPQENRGQYQYHTQATMGRLRAAGYTKPFTSIEEGIRDFVQNYLDFPEYRYL